MTISIYILLHETERPSSVQRDRGKESGKSRRKKKKTRKCTKQRFRDYFIESDGCRFIFLLKGVTFKSISFTNQYISRRSKRPYKMAKCVGGGGNSCVANKVNFLKPVILTEIFTTQNISIFLSRRS